MTARDFDPAAVRDTNLERQKLRLATLCLASDDKSRKDANNMLRGQNGRALTDKLLTNVTLLSMAIANDFDIGAPYGGRDRFLVELVSTPGRQAIEQFEALLDAGWPVNLATEENGTTALMVAAERFTAANRDRVMRLIERGADPHLKDKEGRSTFDRAPVAMRKYIDELLEKRAATNAQETPAASIKTDDRK
ncbi:MAG TPA: ankyrin repeat domain-containing protein [Gammaproteobacteria bacterium]|nr:ankyrin repeat domain-containing protein [Gammaproteobacteria bacterium]